MSQSEPAAAVPVEAQHQPTLRAALRAARIEAAERTSVVVDLRDAELARLEMLNEALDPVFGEIEPDIAIFDRAVVPGGSPRLWVDMLAHVVMGRDKRVYRFLQDTRYGRRVLIESAQIEPIVAAIRQYVARRLVERERALAGDTTPLTAEIRSPAEPRPSGRWRASLLFILGMLLGAASLLTVAWFVEPLL
jgi:hypothetical protein